MTHEFTIYAIKNRIRKLTPPRLSDEELKIFELWDSDIFITETDSESDGEITSSGSPTHSLPNSDLSNKDSNDLSKNIKPHKEKGREKENISNKYIKKNNILKNESDGSHRFKRKKIRSRRRTLSNSSSSDHKPSKYRILENNKIKSSGSEDSRHSMKRRKTRLSPGNIPRRNYRRRSRSPEYIKREQRSRRSKSSSCSPLRNYRRRQRSLEKYRSRRRRRSYSSSDSSYRSWRSRRSRSPPGNFQRSRRYRRRSSSSSYSSPERKRKNWLPSPERLKKEPCSKSPSGSPPRNYDRLSRSPVNNILEKIKKENNDMPTNTEDKKKIIKEEKDVEIKKENTDLPLIQTGAEFEEILDGRYKCHVCNIVLNSEVMSRSHINGKKHKKNVEALNSMKAVEASLGSKAKSTTEELIKLEPTLTVGISGEAAAASTSAVTSKPNNIIESTYFRSVLPQKSSVPEDKPNCKTLDQNSHIDSVLKEIKEIPILELSKINEVHSDTSLQIRYICTMCDANCDANGIIPHITGSNHLLACLKKYRPSLDLRPSEKIKKYYYLLMEIEKKEGRGNIKVVKTSGKIPGASEKSSSASFANMAKYSYLDTSMSDFYCTLCESHMNTEQIWQSHIQGKKHFKNVKKQTGEITIGSNKTVMSTQPSKLLRKLNAMADDIHFPVVGLDFIRETQNPTGNQYNCYLCNGCYIDSTIMTHLETIKHLEKFLSEKNKKEYSRIRSLSLAASYKEDLVSEQCMAWVRKYGSGEVQVYAPASSKYSSAFKRFS